ncbi:HNH endonuclease [Arthrobacter phage Argan]|nr:HNH endonuclease [Arthrobacter phage Argan]
MNDLEWRVVPAYPEYEVTEKGHVRHIATGDFVPTYMGRAKLGEALHPRIRIKSNGIPMPAMAVKELVRGAFKHKPKVKQKATGSGWRVVGSPTKQAPAPDFEPYKEYRRLPEFPKYEISADGTLRNWWTKKKLKKIQNKRTGAYSYGIHTEAGKTTHRNPDKLLWTAWPELAPPPKEKDTRPRRTYSTRGEWCDIPEFGGKYQVHPDGHVRYKTSRRRLEVFEENGEKCVSFFTGSGRGVIEHVRTVDVLVKTYCGEKSE